MDIAAIVAGDLGRARLFAADKRQDFIRSDYARANRHADKQQDSDGHYYYGISLSLRHFICPPSEKFSPKRI